MATALSAQPSGSSEARTTVWVSDNSRPPAQTTQPLHPGSDLRVTRGFRPSRETSILLWQMVAPSFWILWGKDGNKDLASSQPTVALRWEESRGAGGVWAGPWAGPLCLVPGEATGCLTAKGYSSYFFTVENRT